MRSIRLPSGECVPALGMGTWRIGDDFRNRSAEIATLRLGLDLGMKLIDTAEMYGEGKAEELIGEAIQDRRDDAFIVSKVYPHNASQAAMAKSCEASLRRLGTDRIDLYLLHWMGSVPISEVIEGFIKLQKAGKIRYFGVSNLDTEEMEALWKLPGGQGTAANQVLYNLTRRGIEFDLLPWCRKHHLPLMAYSPLEEGALVRDTKLLAFSRKHGITPAHAALAWLLAQDEVIVIPKVGKVAHLKENFEAANQRLTPEQLAELSSLFPAPRKKGPLEMI
ncbi:aldo/keto reductase [soil metagenome]